MWQKPLKDKAGKDLVVSQFEGTVHHEGKCVLRGSRSTWSHCIQGSSRGECWFCLYSLLLIQSKTSAQGMILPLFMVDLLPSVNQIKKLSHRLSELSVYRISFIYFFILFSYIASWPQFPLSPCLPPLSPRSTLPLFPSKKDRLPRHVNGITGCTKAKHKLSYQGRVRHLSRRKRVLSADERLPLLDPQRILSWQL